MSTEPLLDGRVAIVTGASRSIGLAVARRMAANGAAVMLVDIDAAGVAEAAEGLRAEGYRTAAIGADVTDEAGVGDAVTACKEAFGRLDIGVANAGVLHLAPIVDTTKAQWQRVIDVNLTGAFVSLRAFAQAMIEQGEGGRLIATSSLFGRRGGRENVAYAASKFGVIGLVESAAADLAPYEITVNAVCPGQIRTPMGDQVVSDKAALRGVTPESIVADMVGRIPIGRLGSVDEVADTYVYLASPLARYVTGTSILVDGGWMVA